MQHACDFFFFFHRSKSSLRLNVWLLSVRGVCVIPAPIGHIQISEPEWRREQMLTMRPYFTTPMLIRLLRQCSSLHSIEWNTIISLLQHVYFFFFLSVPSVLLAHPSSTKMSTAPSTAQYVAVQMYTFNRNARWRSTSNYITSTITLLAKSRPEYGSPALFFLLLLESLSVQISGIY